MYGSTSLEHKYNQYCNWADNEILHERMKEEDILTWEQYQDKYIDWQNEEMIDRYFFNR